MSGPRENDPALARFRRGAGSRVGPPGPPPVPGSFVAPPAVPPADPAVAPSAGLAPGPSSGSAAGPIAPGTAPEWATTPDPGRVQPLFGDLLGKQSAELTATAYDDDSDEPWLEVDDDPGRNSGIAAIAVGMFVGIVGLFVGIYSIRRSRDAGLTGTLGIVGVIVSLASILVVGVVGLSWVRYEVQVAQQCALVGPGTYLTQSGTGVTCR